MLLKKDFEANRLVSGMLQLAKGTQLIIDETAMTDGQLTAQVYTNDRGPINLTCTPGPGEPDCPWKCHHLAESGI